MGEYAKYNGERIKIGTCEQMYYLRADQVHLIKPERNSVNPQLRNHAESIRFRFPFPNEDNVKPGAFENYDYGVGIYGIEPPRDIDHGSLQFTRNYPESGGMLLSLPCPKGEKALPDVKVHYNGYSGPVHIHSQRLVGDQLVLILRCGDCGALWRVETLDDCKPLLNLLENYSDTTPDFYQEIARRIVAGYTQPNFWTKEAVIA